MSLPSYLHGAASEIVKAVPPVTVASVGLVGITLNEWVLITTLIYTVLQIGLGLRAWAKILKRGHK